jgi:uncharacterized protein YheU (UPF0270 family)
MSEKMNLTQDKILEKPIEVLPSQLSEEALTGIIENFILREATDYGAVEVTYEKKAEQIRKQILKGDIKIIFDQQAESISLLMARDFERFKAHI